MLINAGLMVIFTIPFIFLNSVMVAFIILILWGFGLGGQLLIIAGILLLIAGFIEISANTSFFDEKQDNNIKAVKKR